MTRLNRPYRIITLAAFSLLVLAPLSGAAPPPPTPSTPLPPAAVFQTLMIPFHFASLWALDRSKMQPVQAVAQGSKAVWPLVYDLRPTLVHLTWVPHNFPEAKIPDLVAGKGYTLELVLNKYYALQRGPDGTAGEYYAYAVTPGAPILYGCPPGKTCLGTTIQAKTWYSMPAPWHVELRVKEAQRARVQEQKWILKPCPGDPLKLCSYPAPGPAPMTAIATVERSGPEVSYFTAHLYPTFQHTNCTTCHSLGSPSALEKQHSKVVGGATGQQVSTPRGTLITCGGGCHYVLDYPKLNQILQYVPGKKFDDREWKAPGADMGINWTGKSAVEICKIITTKLPSAQALKHHFQDDIRLAWAVHSGELPFRYDVKPLAPPWSYQEWQKITTTWADNGFPCPK